MPGFRRMALQNIYPDSLAEEKISAQKAESFPGPHAVPGAKHVPVIQMTAVNKSYKLGNTNVWALQNVDLTIPQGAFVTVCGPSGSGKTTLLNLIGLCDVPTSGSVFLNGTLVNDLSDDTATDLRNRYIGFVFQTFNLIPVLSALENVMLPLQFLGISSAQAKECAVDMLAEVGLETQKHSRPDQMSGGQRQRVAIARALVTQPSLVVADEPTANLDTDNSLKVVKLMQNMHQRHGVTFVVSTHDPRVLELVDTRISLCDGHIVSERKQS